MAGIDEAMARHAKETDKVDLLTLKQLKARVNVLEQQIVQDKARQLTVRLPAMWLPAFASILPTVCWSVWYHMTTWRRFLAIAS